MSIAKTHISLNVQDVRRSIAFYEAFFGEKAHKVRADYANFDLSNPPLKLALNQGGAAGKGSLNHLGIQVMDAAEVDAARDRIKAAGLASFDEGDTTCCYALQNKIWVTDPDGHSWEVYVLLDDTAEKGEHPAIATAACCDPCCAD